MNNPLVSVIVLTYNSGKFVEETLDSIKAQTYTNLELIISDDGSKDDTISICEKWLSVHQDFFITAKLLISPVNTGIPANYNRGFRASKGVWLKYIAGDDCLTIDCIEKNIEYVLTHPCIKVLYSFNRVYINTFEEKNFLHLNPGSPPKNIINESITAQEQYISLLEGDRIAFTPTRFFAREVLDDIGLPDEDLFSEDFQLKLRMTKAGYKLYFMEHETVLYRKHQDASNNTIVPYVIKPHYFLTENFRQRYVYPYISKTDRLSNRFCWYVNQIFRINFFNKPHFYNKFLFYFLNTLLNPFRYIKILGGK
jgi:alpha-1,3-rhamnosyltransferase